MQRPPGQMQHRTSLGHSMSVPPQYDAMRNSQHSQGGMPPRQQQPQYNMQQQPPPPQQNNHQQPPPPNNSVMSSSWQSERDTPHRREMIQNIVKILKKDKQGSQSPESQSKLPQMAKQLEVSLYRDAKSFNAYMDINTLKNRLQQIAVQVSRKSTRNQPQQYSNRPPPQQYQAQQQPPQNQRRPDHGGPPSPYQQNPNGMRQPNPPQQQQQQPPHGYNQRPPSNSNRNSRGGGDSDSSRIRHRQQRLLLLHHSAKCPHEDGRCPVTMHCGEMKQLWRHMENCRDNKCRTPHCFSSRAILSHYRKCRDSNCPACGPVRENIKKHRMSNQQNNSGTSSGPLMSSFRDQNPLPGNSNVNVPMQSNSRHSRPPSNMPQNQNPPYMQQQQPPPPPQQPMPPQQPPPQQQQPPPQYNHGGRNSFVANPAPPPQHNGYDPQANGAPPRQPPQQPYGGGAGAGQLAPAGQNRNDPEYRRIRHKQQRLLLLRHASKCTHTGSSCPVTPHCASMKKLWEHIAHCRNQHCPVEHCFSSRYVLSHYRKCRDERCQVCGPVRDVSKRQRPRPTTTNQPPPPAPPLVSNPSIPPVQQPNAFDTRPPDQHNSSNGNYQPKPPPAKKVRRESKPPTQLSSTASAPARPADDRKKPKPVSKYSLLNSFSTKQLEMHLASVDRKTQLTPAKLKSTCLEALKGLQTHQHGWVFNCPVDPVELNLPDYFDIVKKPMDLGTIQKKLENGVYQSVAEFSIDVNMTFDNAMTYNEDGSVVYEMAKELKVKFSSDYKKLLTGLDEADAERRKNIKACTLCGCEKLMFEPPVYFCNGMNCQSQRIRRNSHFYIGGSNQYFWCSTCYNELDGDIQIELADMCIMKSDLVKKKNDEVHEESWVQCDACERWVHQICGLFNTRQNKEHHSEYTCPKCLLRHRTEKNPLPDPKPPSAVDLPRTALSEWLERNLTKKVEARKRELAEEKAQAEGTTMEAALHQLDGGPVIVRQVTAMDRTYEVRELMRKRYAHKNYPEEFPFRCKCIVVFQQLDGIDVLLFALYLYEHGENNPPPNQKVVYISYLDSVHFMRPRRIRTFVYHEILIAYLDYARRRGFNTAHIWACPPLKGDDYIFYAKPEDQKTPRDSRLRQWYIDMLIECQKRSIVGKVTNMYDLYFANENLDATAVPYLEGDYFPGEAENIIKMLEDGGGKKGSKKKKSKGNAKSKGNTGTRSTGVDEEALLASGYLDTKSLKDLDRDQVMVKLGETIQPMKESFIVAFLNHTNAKEEDLVVPEDIEKARIEYAAKNSDDLAGSKRDAIGNVRDVTSGDGSKKVINDDAEDLDCEFLNNRQAFLNLCRGNHYQFDEVRRAKHTSMMVLWHLHNRDAPKFVQQCVACNREILSGKRWHCNTCNDYDLCQDCYKDPNCNRGSCTHTLQPIAVEPDAAEERAATDAQRVERQKKIMAHIQLIEHASRCMSKTCQSKNCMRMKDLLNHASTCREKVQGGCKVCKRMWTLLRIHAQKCKDRNCKVPQCLPIREKMRQIQKQQQAMDDRRRLEMNRHMRFGGAAPAGH